MSITFTKEDALKASLEYFNGDVLATDVCVNKYLLSNNGVYYEKTPEDMHHRLAKEFHRIEKKYSNPLSEEDIFNSLKNFKYIIPGGSALAGIGNNFNISSISNCFYLGSPFDSYGGILKLDQELIQVAKRRGGIGISISSLRPNNSLVTNAAKTSSGAVSFINRFSNSIREVAQSGRRGAGLVDICVEHPDIFEFIKIKDDTSKITGMNLSIKFSNEFMEALIENKDFNLRFPIDSNSIYKTVKAKEIWDKFINSVWKSGEPGCFFWDNVLKHTISDCYSEEGFKTEGTNACGELVMGTKNSCLLIALNLKSFVEVNKFNYELFKKYVRIITRLADNFVDLEIEKIDKIINKIKNDKEPEDIKSIELNLWIEIKDKMIKSRRIGIGVLGLADCIALCGFKYDSEESLKLCEKIFKCKNEIEFETTAILSKERGSFPIWKWEKEKDHQSIKLLSEETQILIKKHGRRNIGLSTIPPTGSISLLTQTSSGIEPIYETSYTRRRKLLGDEEKSGTKSDFVDVDGEKFINYKVIHKPIQEWLSNNPNKKIEDSPWHKCTAHDIKWESRIKLQSVLQKYISHSISSTLNLPENTTKEIISNIYITAWKMGLKGLTTYRDNCRSGIMIKIKEDLKNRIKRKDVLECDIHRSSIDSKNWIFFVGLDNGVPYEIFGGKSNKIEIPMKYKNGYIIKNGKEDGVRKYDLILGSLDEKSEDRLVIHDIASSFAPEQGTFTRTISLTLRHSIPIQYIIQQLHKDSANKSLFCFEKGVARVLKKYLKDGITAPGTCEKCEGKLIYKDGCEICLNCGFSKCL